MIGFVATSARLHLILYALFAGVLLLSSKSIPAAAWLPIAGLFAGVFVASTAFAFVRYRWSVKRSGHPPQWSELSEFLRGSTAAKIGLEFY